MLFRSKKQAEAFDLLGVEDAVEELVVVVEGSRAINTATLVAIVLLPQPPFAFKIITWRIIPLRSL